MARKNLSFKEYLEKAGEFPCQVGQVIVTDSDICNKFVNGGITYVCIEIFDRIFKYAVVQNGILKTVDDDGNPRVMSVFRYREESNG